MRSKSELENVIKALLNQKKRLPEFDFKGRNYWKLIETEIYYTEFLLKHNYLPKYIHHDVDATDCYIWLKGDDDWSNYYDDILIELINHGS